MTNPKSNAIWKAKVTFKGQLTLPKGLRSALSIEEGDAVLFQVEGDRAVLRPLKGRPLSEFYGVLPATKSYPGRDEIRRQIRRKRIARLEKEKA